MGSTTRQNARSAQTAEKASGYLVTAVMRTRRSVRLVTHVRVESGFHFIADRTTKQSAQPAIHVRAHKAKRNVKLLRAKRKANVFHKAKR